MLQQRKQRKEAESPFCLQSFHSPEQGKELNVVSAVFLKIFMRYDLTPEEDWKRNLQPFLVCDCSSFHTREEGPLQEEFEFEGGGKKLSTLIAEQVIEIYPSYWPHSSTIALVFSEI